MNTPRKPSQRARRHAAAITAGVALLGCAALPARAEWSITPRVAYYFDNVGQRQSAFDRYYNTPEHLAYVDSIKTSLAAANASAALLNLPPASLSVDPIDVVQRSDQITFPQFGGTLTFGWRDSEATQISLTALYGKTSANAIRLSTESYHYQAFGAKLVDTDAINARAHVEVTRLDLEATLQHRLNETFSLIGGIRAERTSSDESDSVTELASSNFGNFYVYNLNQYAISQGFPPQFPPIVAFEIPPSTARSKFSVLTYSARIGAAAYAPVGEKHLFYVNGLLHVSWQGRTDTTYYYGNGTTFRGLAVPSETSVGPDISVGYMYRFSDRFGVDLRYRAQVYFPVAGPFGFRDARVNHGVGIGFTSWFGGR
jgi:hypothetical protein